jgi:hypothetical protein
MSSRRYATRQSASSYVVAVTKRERPPRVDWSHSQAISMVLAIAIPALLGAFIPAFAANDDYLLMPRTELLSLPTSGSAWDSLKTVADSSWGTPDLCDQDRKHGTQALAGALVYARTGTATYYTKTRNAIMSAIGTERSDCTILSIGRQLGAYVLAANFIKLGGSDDDTFRTWLSAMRTRTFTGHPRWQTLVGTHADSANNWGAFAGASRIAASLYLGDSADVAQAAAVLRGFLGDRSAWSGFRGQGDSNGTLTDTVRVWACDSSADGFVPVNPACTRLGINLDGGIVNDVSRDDLGLTWPVGPTGIGYTLESLQGLVVQTELLYRNGFSGAWGWSNAALHREANLVTRNGAAGGTTWNTASVNQYVPWILNFRYGLNLPTRQAGYGRVFGYTDWLYGPRSTAPQPNPTTSPTAAPTPAPAATPGPTPAPTAAPTPTPSPTQTVTTHIGFRSASSATSTSKSLAIARPSGVMAGDVLIAVIDVRANARQKLAAPAGWSLVRQDEFRRSLLKAVFLRVATASEPATYTFGSSRAEPTNGMMLALIGVDTRNPIAASSSHGATSSTSIIGPSVSATVGNGYLVGLFATAYDTTVRPPSQMALRAGVLQQSSVEGLTSEATTQEVALGATGDRIAAAADPGDNIGQLLLLRPR